MKTNKNFPKSKNTSFDADKALHSKVVKDKRPGKPLLRVLEEEDEDDLKPIKPTTNSFFDEDYDADAEDEDEEWDDDDDDDDEDDEDDQEDDEELEEFQKIR